jgi:DHA2 family multidrug resistance protein
MRSLGSSVGIAIVGWQVASRSQFHWSVLSAQITPFNPEVLAYLRPLGMSPGSPEGAELIAGLVAAQSSMLAFQDAFWLTGWAAFLMLPVVLILQRPPSGTRAPAGAH